MTRDDIIRMAREAGFHQRHVEPNEWWAYSDAFERFAALVAAAEREECAKVAQPLDCAHRCSVGHEFAAAIRARK